MAWFSDAVAMLRAQGLWREPTVVDGPPGRLITRDGNILVNYSSNNYLGLAEFEYDLAGSGGSGGSRLICGTTRETVALEKALASWMGTAGALAFPSGYQANVATVQAIGALPNVRLFCDALNHASLIDGARLAKAPVTVYPHNDVASLGAMIGSAEERPVVVTESLFSMDGDRGLVGELRKLVDAHDGLLVVDEAHAGGLFGDKGGLCASLGVQPDVYLGTLSKAAGWFGGFVGGSQAAVDWVRHKGRGLMFSTAPARSWFHQSLLCLEKLSHAQAERECLWKVCEKLSETLAARVEGPIFEVRVVDPVTVAERLRAAGLWVQPIRYPTVPRGTERLRITAMASHTDDDIATLGKALREVGAL